MSVTPLQAGPGLDPLLFGAGIVLLIITIYSSVERVSEHEQVVVTVFGEFREILDPGLHLVPPFISRSHSFDTRTRTIDIPAQEGITRDNTPVTAEGVAYAKVMDPKKTFSNVDDYEQAVSNLAQTTLRAVIGDMTLAEVLDDRQKVNARVRKELDEPTDEWGIRIESVEIREITPPQDLQRAQRLAEAAHDDAGSVVEAVPELIDLLDTGGSMTCDHAADALSEVAQHDPTVVPVSDLADLLAEGGPTTREHALEVLFEIARNDPEAVQPATMKLVECAESDDELVRQKATQLLGVVRDSESGDEPRIRMDRREFEGEDGKRRGGEEIKSPGDVIEDHDPADESATDSEPDGRSRHRPTGPTTHSWTESIPDVIPRAPEVSVDYDALRDVEAVGSGGNADVTKATLPTPEGDVTLAIKKPRMAGTLHSEHVERILDEAETWEKLDDHDHVVGIVDWGSEPLPWIAMEYMDGGHLGERAGEMDVPRALWTAIAVTKGVRHAHRRGVAHLDLKPENVLFRTVEDAWDVPKVADWGLSKHLLEHSKSVEGLSPHYAAPEQFEDDYGPTDDITDVYQLGAVFYELFTGRPPFEGRPTKVMRAVMDDRPTPPSQVADVPPGLDTILLTALAKDRDDRYESVLLLRNDLRDVFDEV